MEITKVRFYSNSNKRDEEIKFCSVTFDNGIRINDIILKKYNGELTVNMPARSAVKTDGKRYHYQIIYFSDELYQNIKQTILEQWERYTKNWEHKE